MKHINTINKIRRLSLSGTLVFFIICLLICVLYPGFAKASCPDLNSDGIVNILDCSIVGSCFGMDPSNPTYNPATDIDGDGDVDYDDIMEVISHFGEECPICPEISVQAGLDSITMEVGESQYIAFSIAFQTAESMPYHVSAEQTASPDNGGITWTNDYPSGGWTTNNSITWMINEQVFGNAASNSNFEIWVK